MSDHPDLAEQEALLKVVAGLVPATAQQVGAALGRLSVRLEELTTELAEADEHATRLEHDYQLRYDQAFVREKAARSKPSDALCHANARIATAAEHLELEVAKARVRSLKAACRTLDRRVDVGRTTAATIRSEHRTLSYGGAA